MLHALCAMRTSDGPDFLTHKNIVTDSKTEQGNGYNGNQMGGDDEEALCKWKWVLKASQGKSF